MTCMEPAGLVCAGRRPHNRCMTITYPNGVVLTAVLLAHNDTEIRAISPQRDDALSFTRVQGTWISEEMEPVTLTFEWQRGKTAPIPSEEDCICSKEHAAQLIRTLLSGQEDGQACLSADDLYVFSREGTGIAVSASDLIPV